MENKIKVTVEYEVPKTSKFDALLSEYAIAKKVADETESYYKPLAEAAEEAKFDAILHQLETIKYYAKQIAQLDKYSSGIWITTNIPAYERGEHNPMYDSGNFAVIYRPKESNPFEIKWSGSPFTKEAFNKCHLSFCQGYRNVVGNWDKWKVYQRLEENAMKQLNELIQKQMQRKQEQIDRFNNIQGGI